MTLSRQNQQSSPRVRTTKKTKKKESRICGLGTEFDEVLKQCVVEGRARQEIPKKCNDDDAFCFCDAYGYGSRGPKLNPHPSCQMYVSCFETSEGSMEAEIMTCEPGFAYDTVAQICFFKESVDCEDRDYDDLGTAVPSKCLSEINADDPVCGCGTYTWNSATLVPNECYGDADIEFTCDAEGVVTNELEIGIGDGVRPGRAPEDGYLDAPWLLSESNPDAEYPYKFPLNQTALIMVSHFIALSYLGCFSKIQRSKTTMIPLFLCHFS